MGLAELLKTARIPKGSFYHYFASKEDFGCKLLEQYLDQYVTRLDELLGGDRPDARAALMHYWSLWISTQTSDDAGARCLIVKVGAEVSDISDEMRRILQVGTDTITGRIVQAISDGLDGGSIARTVDPDALGPALYQMWLGASLMAKLSRKPDPLLQAMTATELMLPRAPL
jgi:TetR/AcrR family transcriptional repressor of nem operon